MQQKHMRHPGFHYVFVSAIEFQWIFLEFQRNRLRLAHINLSETSGYMWQAMGVLTKIAILGGKHLSPHCEGCQKPFLSTTYTISTCVVITFMCSQQNLETHEKVNLIISVLKEPLPPKKITSKHLFAQFCKICKSIVVKTTTSYFQVFLANTQRKSGRPTWIQ